MDLENRMNDQSYEKNAGPKMKCTTSRLEVRSVSRICAHLSIVYVTYIIDERAHMRETEP